MQSRISVIDTHTGGEPTRVVIAGGPELGTGPWPSDWPSSATDTTRFVRRWSTSRAGRTSWSARSCCRRSIPACAAGVIFFNNVGYLGMCGHGTIGVAVALAYLGRIGPGAHRLETPVGVVTIALEDRNTVTIDNVESYRLAKDVSVTVPGLENLLRRRRLGRELVLSRAGSWRDPERGQRGTADRSDLADSPGT